MASRSDGVCLDCVSPAKTQRAFRLQKSQLSREAHVHTCKKRAPWVPSACGQEDDQASGRRRGMGNQDSSLSEGSEAPGPPPTTRCGKPPPGAVTLLPDPQQSSKNTYCGLHKFLEIHVSQRAFRIISCEHNRKRAHDCGSSQNWQHDHPGQEMEVGAGKETRNFSGNSTSESEIKHVNRSPPQSPLTASYVQCRLSTSRTGGSFNTILSKVSEVQMECEWERVPHLPTGSSESSEPLQTGRGPDTSKCIADCSRFRLGGKKGFEAVPAPSDSSNYIQHMKSFNSENPQLLKSKPSMIMMK
ncbi:hypothetical protein E5288_WYG001150 [Bos mutus]|uniref:Uncharacterized protein n=1 Tax=Bos mutus TaxID=72004 RepID=A0A6B0RWD1_9CETA|nr:hypothetical protein [Bos mutus]